MGLDAEGDVDLAVDDAPVQQRDSKAAWVTEPRHGARRPWPYVPGAPSEPDRHERGVGWLESRRQPLTGSDMCWQASYRRKPPYVTLPAQGGACVLQLGESSLTEARRWSVAFACMRANVSSAVTCTSVSPLFGRRVAL